MKRPQHGFTLLELVIVLAIVAILAALALPAYSDYGKKAKISEVMLALTPPKAQIMEHVAVSSAFPAASQLGMSATSSQYVESVTYARVSDAEVTITARVKAGSISSDIDGMELVLTGKPGPGGLGTGSVDWTCAGSIPSRYLVAACRPVT
jgi:type IV pilus assembly protein PilA